MSKNFSIESVILQYLDNVAKSSPNMSKERRDMLLGELREHINEAMTAHTRGRPATLRDAYAALAEMDLPETYAETPMSEAGDREPSQKLVFLAVLCSFLQIVGLGATVAGIPVVGAIAGFAAIVSFFLVWSRRRSPKWLIRLTGIAAICGLGMIVLEMAMAL